MGTLPEPNDGRLAEDEEKVGVLKNTRGDTVGVAVGNPNLKPTPPVSVGNMVDCSPSDPKTSASYT